MAPPKKYVKIDGVMKMNPAYKAWKTNQESGGKGGAIATASAVPVNPNALPVVSNMDDHMQMNADLGIDVPLAESTDGKQKVATCGAMLSLLSTPKNSRKFCNVTIILYFHQTVSNSYHRNDARTRN